MVFFSTPAWSFVSVTALLAVSNLMMTFAWYGHLKFKSWPLWIVILISWGIAFFEYCFQVPANRYGHTHLSAAELKTIQEVLSIGMFIAFSYLYLGETLRISQMIGFGFILVGAVLIYQKWI